MSKLCDCCQQKIGFLTGRVKISDGIICSICFTKAGYSTTSFASISKVSTYTLSEINEKIEKHNKYLQYASEFRPSKTVGIIKFDNQQKTFSISSRWESLKLYRYDQIFDIQIIQDENEKVSDNIGSLLLASTIMDPCLSFLAIGLCEKKHTFYCKKLALKVILMNADVQDLYIPFIKAKTKTSTAKYDKAVDLINEALTSFALAVNSVNHPVSIKAEIERYQKLLDYDLISEDEFQTKLTYLNR